MGFPEPRNIFWMGVRMGVVSMVKEVVDAVEIETKRKKKGKPELIRRRSIVSESKPKD